MKGKITLYLMGYKGYKVLESISDSSFVHVAAVVGATDKNIQDDCYEDIKRVCKEKNIAFHNRKENIPLTSEYAIAISWRWLIDIHSVKLIILHDSLLPKYRGFNPLVSALLNKEEKIGVTALFASEQYDRGDIIKQASRDIKYPIKIEEAIEMISFAYIELAEYILANIENLSSYVQDEAKVSYSLWRDEEDYSIDWNCSSEYIKRLIDAVGYPYLGAKTIVNKEDCIRIIDAEIVEDVHIENRQVGKIIFLEEGKPIIVCGTGLLKINTSVYDTQQKPYVFTKLRSRFT